MSIAERIKHYQNELAGTTSRLIAISKTKPIEDILKAYEVGQRDFGENKVQEITDKFDQLPKDIKWHMVGHLQRNKVKFLAPFVHLIHGVDSPRLAVAINKEGKKVDRTIPILLQLYIAQEDSKFGFAVDEVMEFLASQQFKELQNIEVRGLMGIATNTDDNEQVAREFQLLKDTFDQINAQDILPYKMTELSSGMTNDYKIAIEKGSTMIRIGTDIFGARNYAN